MQVPVCARARRFLKKITADKSEAEIRNRHKNRFSSTPNISEEGPLSTGAWAEEDALVEGQPVEEGALGTTCGSRMPSCEGGNENFAMNSLGRGID